MNKLNKNKKIINIFLLYFILIVSIHIVIKLHVNSDANNIILIENSEESLKNHIEATNKIIYIKNKEEFDSFLNNQENNLNNEYILLFISISALSILLGFGIYKIFTNTFFNLENLKNLNEKLEESEKRWQFAIEGNNDGLWDWNIKTNEVFYSPQWKKMLGYNEDDIKNSLKSWENIVHPDDLENTYKDIKRHLNGETDNYQNEHRIKCKDGTYKWVLGKGKIIQKDFDGTPLRIIGTNKDINERKKLSLEVEHLKNRFINIFKEHSAIMLLVIPETGEILDANKSAQNFYGYSLEEFKSLKISDINTLSQEELKKKRIEAKEHHTNHFIFKHKLKNGEIRDVDVNSSPINTPTGEILFSIIEDVTQKLVNEKKLEKTVNALKEAQKIAKLGIWELDIVNNTLEWSDEIYNIFELDKKQFKPTYEKFLEVIHPEDREKVNRAYEKSLITKKKYEINHRLKLNDGTIKYVQEQCDTKFDENGNPIKSIGTIYDITHIHELTTIIEQERYKYQKLMESSSDAIFITNTKGDLIDYSKEAKKLLGYTNGEMHSLNIIDWEVNLTKEEIEENINSFTKKPTIFETVHKRKDGSTFIASVLASKLTLHQKEYIYASVRDVTEQKELENKLIEQSKTLQIQKEEFESIFKYSKDGIAITDLETNFLDFNDAYLNITGFSREELLTKSCIGLTVLEHKEEAHKLIAQAIEKGFMENIEKECIVNNGKRIYTNMSASLLPDKKRLLIVLKDVTSLKQIEDQSRLIAMGEMIGNIAHQWRQPLSIISTSASGLKFKLEYDNTLDSDFINYTTDKIVEQTKYLSKTIDDFRNFIKDDKEYKEIPVRDVIQSSLNLVEAVLKNNYIKLIKDIDDDLMIQGNKNELQQALINILNNAKDILKEKIDDDESRYIFIKTKKVNDTTLELNITDSAGGIDKEIINRVFEPYFTTKHQTVGTGLGLAMVDKIVRERHGFNIKVFNEEYSYENKRYMGANFSITFTSTSM